MAAELAAQRATEPDRRNLAAIVNRMREAHEEGRFDDELSGDVEFHNAVGEAAHNIVLMHTLRSCYRLLSDDIFYNRHLIFSIAGAHDEVLRQHVAIHDAIAAADPVAARMAAEGHIDFIVETTAKAHQAREWDRISRLRQQQRSG